MRRAWIVVSVLALLFLAITPVIAQEEDAHIRVAHFSPDTPAVDIYVDGEVAIAGLAFPEITDFVSLPAGGYEIAVAPADTSIEDAAIGPAELIFDAGSWTTIAAIGSLETGTLAPAVLAEDLSDTDGPARVNVFHAIEGAPAVDVLADGGVLIRRLGYPGTLGNNDGAFDLEVEAGSYDLSVTVTGDASAEVLSAEGFALEENTVYFIAAVGTADAPQVAVASVNLDMMGDDMMMEAGNIVEVAQEAGSFTTLLAAAEAAGLAETLADGGPFTVFAPTGDAFAALLEALGVSAEDVLADTEMLTTVLLYHVLDGAVMAETVVTLDGESVATLQGEMVSISIVDGGVVLNDSVNVVATDVAASNGVIHVIDGVLLPPSSMAMEADMSDDMMMDTGNIVEVAQEAGSFTTLLAAAEAAGLADTLADGGPFTVFAPTDDAFAALLESMDVSAEDLLADTDLLTTVLLYHVLDGAVIAETVVTLDGESVATLQGEMVSVSIVDGGVVLNDTVNVVATDVTASNGVIHVIDGVLLPPTN